MTEDEKWSMVRELESAKDAHEAAQKRLCAAVAEFDAANQAVMDSGRRFAELAHVTAAAFSENAAVSL